MTSILIGVLALQGAFAEHQHRIERINQLKDSPELMKTFPKVFSSKVKFETRLVKKARDLDGLHGLLLPGGESTAMSVLNKDLFQAIKHLMDEQDFPVMGTCAGMILLADKVLHQRPGHLVDSADSKFPQRFIGGLGISVLRNYFGSQVDSFETNLRVDLVNSFDFHAVFIRAPVVWSIDDKRVQILCEVDTKEGTRVVGVKQGNRVGICFHPELTEDLSFHLFFCDLVLSNKDG